MIGDLQDVGTFGKVAAEQPIGILVGPARPGAWRFIKSRQRRQARLQGGLFFAKRAGS